MHRFDSLLSFAFRPRDETLSSRTRDRLAIHRLLTLLGGALALGFGYLETAIGSGAPTPTWPSFVLAGLFGGLLGSSYLSSSLRRHVVGGTRTLSFALMGWLTAVTIASGFTEGYATLLLFAYVTLAPAIAYASRSFWAAGSFAGFVLLITAYGAFSTSAPEARPFFLLGCMIAATLVEGLAATLLAKRHRPDPSAPTAGEQLSVPSITENAPAALFRTAPGQGLIYANRAFAETFGYRTVVDILLADLDALFVDPDERDRLWTKAKREGELRNIEMQMTRNNGSVFTGLLNIRVAYGENDEVVCFDGTVTDISERKRCEQARRQSMVALARSADENDYSDPGHVERVASLARLLAGSLGLPAHWQNRIEEAAPFHDVGKIGVAEQILHKPGPLSDEERQTMKQHASIGPALLSGSKSEYLRIARRIARSHHERWDGDGYPDGLEGNEIPLAARIVAVADAFDAMTHDRPYQQARSPDEAFAVIQEEAGAQFDPKVSKAALQCREAMTEIVTGEESPRAPLSPTREIQEAHQGGPSLSDAQSV